MLENQQVRFGGGQTKKEQQRHLVGWLPTFDGINHEALLNKLHTYPLIRHIIEGWLKAGIMEGLDFSPTERGTPQGGAISPLLMNIALHGMEKAMTEAKYKGGKPILIRYADDFMLLHPDKNG